MICKHLVLGPVLSFRGIQDGNRWRVTALVGLKSEDGVPAVIVDGDETTAPLLLHEHRGVRYLRYDLSVAMQDQERSVEYGFAGDVATWRFMVPGIGYAPRMTYVSCNGFSDPSGMRKLVRPADAVWEDLIACHDRDRRRSGYQLDKEQLWHEQRIHDQGKQRFHLLLMGGDQIYFDSIWEDIPELKRWVSLSRSDQLRFKVTKTLKKKVQNYYWELYSERWLPKARKDWGASNPSYDAAEAMSSIPTIMMWDDHDIFDGWGSYTAEMQQSEIFQLLFRCARQAFWVFQMQHSLQHLPELSLIAREGLSNKDPQFQPLDWQALREADELLIPILGDQPGFTSGFNVGPVSIVVADLRTERSRNQIMGESTWSALQHWMNDLEAGEPAHPGTNCQHLVFLSSVPVAHPKLTLIEGLLDTFGQDHVQDSSADDLKDHWAHDDHEGERKRLIEILTKTAERKRLRATIVSGDVHVSAWGTAYRSDQSPSANWAHIHQLTSSAVVHPSLVGVAERLFFHVLNKAARNRQDIDVHLRVEMMLFPNHNHYIMPARNWLALELDMGDESGSHLWATWRCENETGFSNHLQSVQPVK